MRGGSPDSQRKAERTGGIYRQRLVLVLNLSSRLFLFALNPTPVPSLDAIKPVVAESLLPAIDMSPWPIEVQHVYPPRALALEGERLEVLAGLLPLDVRVAAEAPWMGSAALGDDSTYVWKLRWHLRGYGLSLRLAGNAEEIGYRGQQ